MRNLCEILNSLNDSEWHDKEEIKQKTQMDDEILTEAIEFLREIKAVVTRDKGRKIHIAKLGSNIIDLPEEKEREIEIGEIEVLFIDDEPDVQELAKKFMENHSERIKIDTVGSTEDALKNIENNNYDVIISDYLMPRIDGLEFLESIREKDEDIPFVILTGRGGEEIAMKALNLGADRYFQKGGAPKTEFKLLAETVTQIVEQKRVKEWGNIAQVLIESNLRGEIESASENLGYVDESKLPEEDAESIKEAIENINRSIELIKKISERRSDLNKRLKELKKLVYGTP